MNEISLVTLQKFIDDDKNKSYDLIPSYVNFDVDQNLYIIKRLGYKNFKENYCTLSELLRVPNVNIFDSVIFTKEQYNNMLMLRQKTNKNDGSLIFILMYYLIFLSFAIIVTMRIFN